MPTVGISDLPLDLARVASEAVEICRRLIPINTVNPYSGDPDPGGEAPGQAFLAPLLEELGATVTLFEPPPDIYQRMGTLGPAGRVFTGRPNLVAEWRFGRGAGPRILIQGHIDTVGVTGMTIEPFSAKVEGGRIWGRGSTDMKGGMAAAVAALRELARHAAALDGSVVLLSVVDEECDGAGAGSMACVDRGYRGDVAICVDGSGPLITHGCNGVLTCCIHLRTEGGHAARLGSAATAVDKAVEVAAAIRQFRARRWTEKQAAVNLGVLRSGTHPAVVATQALLAVNIVYTLEEAREAEAAGYGYGGVRVREAFAQAVREVAPEAELEWVKDLIPFSTPAQHPIISEFAAQHASVTGTAPALEHMPAWSDACYLAQHGGMPTLIYGAGVPDKAHAPDEYTEIWRVETCAQVLSAYLYNKLGRS